MRLGVGPKCVCVCMCGTHPQVKGQRDQHAAVVHEAGELAAVVQLPVPGEEQRRLEAHGTCTHRHRVPKSKSPSLALRQVATEIGWAFSSMCNKQEGKITHEKIINAKQ